MAKSDFLKKLMVPGILAVLFFCMTGISGADEEIVQIKRNYGLQLGKGRIGQLLLDETHNRVIVSWTGNIIEFFDIKTGKSMKMIPISSNWRRTTISPDDKVLAVVTVNGVLVIDCKEMAIVREIPVDLGEYRDNISTFFFQIFLDEKDIYISGDRLFVYMRSFGDLYIFDIKEGKTVKKIALLPVPADSLILNLLTVPWVFDRECNKLLDMKKNGIYEYDLMKDEPVPVFVMKLPSEFQSLSGFQLIAYFSSRGRLIYRRGADIYRYDLRNGTAKRIITFKTQAGKYPVGYFVNYRKSGKYVIISKQFDLSLEENMKYYLTNRAVRETWLYNSELDTVEVCRYPDETGGGYPGRDGRIYNSNCNGFFCFDPDRLVSRKSNGILSRVPIEPQFFDVSNNGEIMAGCNGRNDQSKRIIICNTKKPEIISEIKLGKQYPVARFSTKENKLLAFSREEELIFYDTSTGKFSGRKLGDGFIFFGCFYISDDFSILLSIQSMSREGIYTVSIFHENDGYRKKQDI